MFEIIMIVAGCVLMAKVADAEDKSAFLWGGLTLLLCVLFMVLLPWGLLRIFLGVLAAFVAMMVVKAMQNR